MSTQSTADILAQRLSQFKQKQSELTDTVRVYEPKEIQPIIIRPNASSWEDLEQKLDTVINLPGLWITIRKLYEEGKGAELETAAEIAIAIAKKSPINLFAAMVSKKSGNWTTRTLKMVAETWEVRRNALQVIDKLALKADSAKAILAIAWRLKGTIMRFLGIATEKGTGIRNPIGLFFALTKKTSTA
jgi:hypothetical protein